MNPLTMPTEPDPIRIAIRSLMDDMGDEIESRRGERPELGGEDYAANNAVIDTLTTTLRRLDAINQTPERMMEDLLMVALRAVNDHIVRHMIKQIDGLDCDISAIGAQHIHGYRAGFREAQRQMTILLTEAQSAKS
jgi:hypothetical protein